MVSNKLEKKILFKSVYLKISRLNLKSLEKQIELRTKNRKIQQIKGKLNNKLNIDFINFDWNFFYGLIDYVYKYSEFKIALFKLFINMIYSDLNFSLVDSNHNNKLVKLSASSLYKLNNCLLLDYDHLVKYFKNLERFRLMDDSNIRNILIANNNSLILNIKAINLIEKNHIIRAWSSVVLCWLNKKLRYDCYWAYFSTFGGAYSSLGEDSCIFAKKAENVSIQQLVLATAFNDPNAICRCKLFLAFSQIQLGKYKQAKLILKSEYKKFKENNHKEITDGKLIVMCIAGLKKLRFSLNKAKHLSQE